MVVGVVSLILWALIIIVTLKYVVLVLRADNNGEGGTLSLVTLAQRALGHSTGLTIILGMVGASLFYGDAIITPAISVLSARRGPQAGDARLRSLRGAAQPCDPDQPVRRPAVWHRERGHVLRADHRFLVPRHGARWPDAHPGRSRHPWLRSIRFMA